jgi:hypothetical protein
MIKVYSAPGNVLGVAIQIFTPPKHFLEHLSQKGYLDHYSTPGNVLVTCAPSLPISE